MTKAVSNPKVNKVTNPQVKKVNNEAVTKENSANKTAEANIDNKTSEEGPKQVVQPPLKISTDAANNFLNIIDVIMIGDPRGQSIMTHFQNMMVSQNPELKQQSPQE